MSVRALLYARYSSDNQSEASIDDQLRICRARAEREGWSIVAEHTDAAISGAKLERPGYQALLADLRAGKADIVLAESLDRISRDQEHIAAFFKAARFAGARIITLSDGEVGEFHVGFRGAMGALYLRDLAEKTRRGSIGRILKGRSFGPPAYGYRIVRRLADDGELDRGLREVDPDQAAVVRRIFAAYLGGQSAIAIARRLNAEGITGPGGALWYPASIRGRPYRNDGLLRNQLYVGKLVWNRARATHDPASGRLVRKTNTPEEVVTADVPHLRIVDDATFDAVQRRLAAESVPGRAPRGAGRAVAPDTATTGFWDQRRPRHLTTRKVFCGVCGCQLSAIGANHLACRNGLVGGCHHRRGYGRRMLEARILDALERSIMDPGDFASFAEAFNAAWAERSRELSASQEGLRRELAGVTRKLQNIADALADGFRGPTMLRQMQDLESRKADLESRLAPTPRQAPILQPDLAEAYRARVTLLRRAVLDTRAPDVIEAIRALIDRVVITPGASDEDPPTIEIVATVTELLRAAGADVPTPTSASHPADIDLFERSVKAAAGASRPLPGSRGGAPRLAFSGAR